MLFRRTEQKRTNPYVAITIGTLATIGAFNVVRCAKRTVRCIKNKVKVILRSSPDDDCMMG